MFGCSWPSQHQRICYHGDLWWFGVPAVAVRGLRMLEVRNRFSPPLAEDWTAPPQCPQLRHGHRPLPVQTAGTGCCEEELNFPFQLWSKASLTHILYSETTIFREFIQVFVSFNHFNWLLKCKLFAQKNYFRCITDVHKYNHSLLDFKFNIFNYECTLS